MSRPSNRHTMYVFDQYSLDVERGSLTVNGEDIKLRPKSFQLLQLLIERHGCLVSKEEILSQIWGATVVTDDAVTQCLMDIRRALDDRAQKYVRTVPRRGYIFDAPISERGKQDPADVRFSWTGWRGGIALVLLLVGAAIAWSLADRESHEPGKTLPATRVVPYSIAVLPFLDLSPDEDIGYFAEGIAEEILNLLAQVDGLSVIARTSSFSFDRKSADVAMIRERLNVTHVLEGSVRKYQDTIRITVQLIDAANSKHVWSATYDRNLGHVFAIQDEIAAEVLQRLVSSLSIAPPKVRQTNAEAYRLYLQAVHMVDQLDRGKNAEAEAIMRRVIELDSEFAPAWRELSRLLWRRIGAGPSLEEDIAAMHDALVRARSIAPDDAATLAYLGWYTADFDGDVVGGAQLFERALSLGLSNENVVRTSATFSRAFAKLEDAVRLAEFGVSRNPLCYPCYVQLASAYEYAGRLEEAEITSRTMQSVFDTGYDGIGIALLQQGWPERAHVEFSKASSEFVRLFGTALALHDLGKLDESRAVLGEYLELVGDRPNWGVAQAYAWTGQTDAAFEEIEKAAASMQLRVDGRIVRWNLINLSIAARHPMLRSLHDDPRWGEFLDRYGISPNDIAEVSFSVEIPNSR